MSLQEVLVKWWSWLLRIGCINKNWSKMIVRREREYLGIMSSSLTYKMFYGYELLVEAINHNTGMSTNPKIWGLGLNVNAIS